ncbi:MAG TPA: aminotransferase class IV [Bacteroidia bacterium]|nr:aminotransferase class IV [Bacteroidia bacterium]
MYILNGHLTRHPIIDWNNRAYRYGDAFFETMLYRDGRVKLLPFHYQRMEKTLALLQMEKPGKLDYERVDTEIAAVANFNDLETAKIRITFWRNGGGTYLPDENSTYYLIEALPVNPGYLELNEKGHVLDIYRDSFKNTDILANLKTVGCLTYTLASLFVQKQGIDDAILLNNHGRVAECTSSNIFCVINNEIITPPLSEGCLDGVMRRHLLETLPAKGFTVKEQLIELAALEQADEIFTTNALGVKWVGEIRGINRPFKNNISRGI